MLSLDREVNLKSISKLLTPHGLFNIRLVWHQDNLIIESCDRLDSIILRDANFAAWGESLGIYTPDRNFLRSCSKRYRRNNGWNSECLKEPDNFNRSNWNSWSTESRVIFEAGLKYLELFQSRRWLLSSFSAKKLWKFLGTLIKHRTKRKESKRKKTSFFRKWRKEEIKLRKKKKKRKEVSFLKETKK